MSEHLSHSLFDEIMAQLVKGWPKDPPTVFWATEACLRQLGFSEEAIERIKKENA
jgi:hypothetical protein